MGVDEIKTPAFDAYPNPATSEVTIDLKTGPVSSWVMYDSKGRRVINDQNTPTERIRLSVDHLEPGVYTLTLSEGYSPIRIVVQ